MAVNTENIPDVVIERAESAVPEAGADTRIADLVVLREATDEEVPRDATKYDKIYYYEIEDTDIAADEERTYYGVIYYHSRMGEASKRRLGIETK